MYKYVSVALLILFFTAPSFARPVNEVYGGVSNEKQVHSTTSYPAADDLSINEGDYYIVVAYFSDGTRLTSKVHQK